MNIKSEFTLLKNTENILDYPKASISRISVPNGNRIVANIMALMEDQMKHFTSKAAMSLIKNPNMFEVVKDETYPLHVSYNRPTDQVIININPFNVDTITAINPDPRNIYACLVYGAMFRNLVTKSSTKIRDVYAGPIIGFLTSMIVQMFGKEYGLLGKYATSINLLRFLISTYILVSFFQKPKKEAYEKSKSVSMFNYKDIEQQLNTYDFSNIDDFIVACSDFKVLPGITKYHFAGRVFKLLTESFLPALEDMSRFVCSIVVSDIPGSSIVPRFIYKYNQDDYDSILDIGRLICGRL